MTHMSIVAAYIYEATETYHSKNAVKVVCLVKPIQSSICIRLTKRSILTQWLKLLPSAWYRYMSWYMCRADDQSVAGAGRDTSKPFPRQHHFAVLSY